MHVPQFKNEKPEAKEDSIRADQGTSGRVKYLTHT